jgi:hypothetical protein
MRIYALYNQNIKSMILNVWSIHASNFFVFSWNIFGFLMDRYLLPALRFRCVTDAFSAEIAVCLAVLDDQFNLLSDI